jgi:hypothetical protein
MDTSRLRAVASVAVRAARRNTTLGGRPGRSALRALRAAATPSPITRERAVSRMERLNAMTMLVSSTEHLARPGDRVRGGYNDWDVERRKLHSRAPRFGAVIDVAARPAATRSLHAARIGASLAHAGWRPSAPRGRPGAVVAEQAKDLARRGLQADTVERPHVAVVLGQVLDLDGRARDRVRRLRCCGGIV